jgi:uncharacterized membrane protein (DUF4010 family)
VLSPRRIGLFIALIAGINYVGYVLERIFGRRRGAGLTGLVGGLASSTAVTAAMAEQSRRAPSLVVPNQLGTLLANVVLVPRLLVIVRLLSGEVARQVWWPLVAMASVIVVGAAWKWRALRATPPSDEPPIELELQNPFALLPALKWGAFLCFVLVISAVAQRWLGDRGVMATAALSGFADVDAISLAVSRQVSAGHLAARVAALAITIAVFSNTAVKMGIAWISGGRACGRDVAVVLGAAMAVAIAVVLVQSP